MNDTKTLTLKELCERATPGPYISGSRKDPQVRGGVDAWVRPARPNGGDICSMSWLHDTRRPEEELLANAQLIARIASPAVALRVYEALEATITLLESLPKLGYAHKDSGKPICYSPDGAMTSAKCALRLLDGLDDGQPQEDGG